MISKLGIMKFFLLCSFLLLTTVLFAQNRFDIIIDELMADPSPQVGLPANEWIELKNTSNAAINLQGWRIGDGSGQSGAMPSFTLAPDSFVIVCTGSAAAAMSAFGTVISVTSFPSLDNDGEQLYLKAPNGQVIHSLLYTSAWYQNEIKKGGGWSLEMIDTHNPCNGFTNWKASINPAGGTPGKINSVNAANPDVTAPSIKNVYAANANTIVLEFDESVDSVSAATPANYSVSNNIGLLNAETISPVFNEVHLTTSIPLVENTAYTITVSNLKDCIGNNLASSGPLKFGLASATGTSDLVINEILFNPRPGAYDYIEIYNRSNKIADASKLFLANRGSNGTIGSPVALASTTFTLFPGEYLVATEDAANLALNYLVERPADILTVNSLPSFPDDEGFVVLLNQQGDVIDEVHYFDDWHFKLLDNPEGVSLERLDAGTGSQEAANWHSAASTAGYGTPGYKNSQVLSTQSTASRIEVSPKVFSPDNDGFNDIAIVRYNMDQPGYIANITIFDAAGRPVRNLVRNGTLALNGSWNWDGLDDKGLKLAVGTYIIFTEVFNLSGKKERFKNTLVLARKLR
jgi:hypothetical protein